MASLDEWFRQIEKLGQADVPMDFDGIWMTPRQYYGIHR